MTLFQARKFLTVLMGISLLTLVLAAVGFLDTTVAAEPQTGTIKGQTVSTVAASPSTTVPVSPAAKPTAGAGSQAGSMQELAIAWEWPTDGPVTGLRRWPRDSSIETVYQDLTDQFVGRSRSDQPLTGISVIIDPGHGGQDGGSIYPVNSASPFIVEKTITLEVARKLADQLEDLGASVLLTREDDAWRSVYYRIALASQTVLDGFIAGLADRGRTASGVNNLTEQLTEIMTINNDSASSGGRGIMNGLGAGASQRLLMDINYQFPEVLLVSLHCNALANNESVSGTQVFYQTSDQSYAIQNSSVRNQDPLANAPVYMMYRDKERRRLANLIHGEIVGSLPSLLFQGEAVQDSDYAILRELNLTSVMVELGFVSNASDRQILTSQLDQSTIATAMSRAIYRFYCEN